LTDFVNETNSVNDKRKEINRRNAHQAREESKKSDNYKNPWDKVIANVEIKEADYKGNKDVSRFRQALLNKKGDLSDNFGNF